MLSVRRLIIAAKRWNDFLCDERRRYICRRPCPVEVSSSSPTLSPMEIVEEVEEEGFVAKVFIVIGLGLIVVLLLATERQLSRNLKAMRQFVR